jgi:hypothetical protein
VRGVAVGDSGSFCESVYPFDLREWIHDLPQYESSTHRFPPNRSKVHLSYFLFAAFRAYMHPDLLQADSTRLSTYRCSSVHSDGRITIGRGSLSPLGAYKPLTAIGLPPTLSINTLVEISYKV